MIRVGVLRGGPSREYDVSLKTGAEVLSVLRAENMQDNYKAIDILVDKNGAWHVNGLPTNLEKIHTMVDVIWNALHGSYGEDGKVQQELDQWSIPYTGSGAFASALGMHKLLAKNEFAKYNFQTPACIVVPDWRTSNTDLSRREYMHFFAVETFKKMPPFWVVKPVSSGSSDRVFLCSTVPKLEEALMIISEHEGDIMIEEHIAGQEISVNVIEGFRGQKFYHTPPLEILKPRNSVYGFEDKYIKPLPKVIGRFLDSDKEKIINTAFGVHQNLGLDHYSKIDMILHPRKGVYVLEIDTLPTLAENSLLKDGLDAVGISSSEFVKHIIGLTLRR